MLPYQLLPNKPIIKTATSHISALCLNLGLTTFHAVCDYVWKLPYGRNTNRANWRLILDEKCGTCSTKHAFLKALADELNLEIELTLGIYPMNEQNTQGVGAVLNQFHLTEIPEAHCYLRYQGKMIDLTRYNSQSNQAIDTFFIQYKIKPDDIGEYKVTLHQKFIAEYYGSDKFQSIWAIREQCISALHQ